MPPIDGELLGVESNRVLQQNKDLYGVKIAYKLPIIFAL